MINYILNEWSLISILLTCLLTVVLAIFALAGVRDRIKDEIAKVLWTALIVFIPIIGSIAFFIVHPKEFKRVEERD
jgi:cytochrome bd-type quinol oxidase subunit 2